MQASLLSPLTSVNEISRHWLEKVLHHKLSLNIKVNSWTAKSPEVKRGFLSEISFVTVSYSCSEGPEQEKSLVVKLLPENTDRAQTVAVGKLGRREAEFYKYTDSDKFKTFCQKGGSEYVVPCMYWAEAHDYNFTIVLNNLTSDGYKLSVPPEGNSLDEIKCILRSIALIHASGVANDEIIRLRSLGSPWDPKYLENYLKSGIERQIKLFEGMPVAEKLEALKNVALEVIGVWQKYPLVNTLVHGDMSTDNAMFSHDNKSACIFDWQFACVGNPLADVVSLLLLSSNPSIFNDNLMEVLECYWQSFQQALNNNGVSVDVSFQDVLANIEKMWMHGFMFYSVCMPNKLDFCKITEERARAIVTFLDNMGVFDKFLQSLQ